MLPPFERVVAEHGAVVLRVCRALLNPTDAQDAWSETFLSALEAYPALRPDSNVRGWLVTIAHRKAIDLHRKAARTRSADGRAAGPAPLPTAPDGDPSLWAAVAALPEKQRLAVVHHHLAGLPYAEIAALTGSTPAAARRAAADGIATLRRLHSDRSPVMTPTVSAAVRRHFRPTTAELLTALHDRLVARRRPTHLIDVGYRTVDSPVGALLVAATDAGCRAGGLRLRRATTAC